MSDREHTYEVTVELPDLTITNLTIRDDLPAGMAYVVGSLQILTNAAPGQFAAATNVAPSAGPLGASGEDLVVVWEGNTLLEHQSGGADPVLVGGEVERGAARGGSRGRGGLFGLGGGVRSTGQAQQGNGGEEGEGAGTGGGRGHGAVAALSGGRVRAVESVRSLPKARSWRCSGSAVRSNRGV